MPRNHADKILDLLVAAINPETNLAELSASTLAHALGCPEPSIRRSIQTLRNRGYNIAFGLDGNYAYRRPSLSAPTVAV